MSVPVTVVSVSVSVSVSVTGHDKTRAYTRVHARTRAYTRVHARTRAYTRVHARTRGYTRVHAGTRGYARVRVLTLNSMYLAHKWTQKWTKYATGEDAGSGVWTIGHAGSRGFARVHARTFPCTYFGSLNAQRDRGSPYDEYNTLKTALDCDVYRQSQPMSRAKTETETSESEKMFAQRPSAPRHVTSLNPSKIALTYCVTVAYCTEATKKAKQHHQTGRNLFIRHFWCIHVCTFEKMAVWLFD